MELLLRVIGWPDEVTERPPLVARFDASGGLIGRAESARLSLPDPKRTVSRFHGHVSYDDGTYYLEDMGSTNPPLVNGRPIPPGQRHQIRPGDRLRIGQYTIAVEFEDPDFPATQLLDPSTRMGLNGELDDAANTERTQVLVRESLAVRPAASGDEMWRSFLDGAQVELELPAPARPELLRTAGSLLRVLLAGVRRLAVPRAEGQGDSEATPLKSRNNNPLRFASDDRRAMAALLRTPPPGFLAGAAAIEDLLADLSNQSAASRAAAISMAERLLARIAPAALERRMVERRAPSMGWFPLLRKARLWDAYVEEMRSMGAGNANAVAEMLRRAHAEALAAEIARMKKANGRRRETAPSGNTAPR
ncbi:MAG TPA: type VI secretion system-associated FHA domain protein [Burkholderiaceae bacterium]|nr:type VI secretion system-associated FHA domain protein [Burkholderiaceae bacterium]